MGYTAAPDGWWQSFIAAAPVRTAKLAVSRLDGSPLRYNRRDPWLPDLLICRADLAEDSLRAVNA